MPLMSDIKNEPNPIIDGHCALCNRKGKLKIYYGYYTCERCIKRDIEVQDARRKFLDVLRNKG